MNTCFGDYDFFKKNIIVLNNKFKKQNKQTNKQKTGTLGV